MSVFGAYSRYYDLLYKDKDYAAEAAYVRKLIERDHPRAKSLLDLGCGTGKHAFLLAESGYRVTGVDLSQDMLNEADAQLAAATPEQAQRWAASGAAPEFLQGDVRNVRVGAKFDVVVSLFHVISYQSTNADLKAAFVTAREHLAPGGLFVFDCWYGPAVLTERPEVRVRRLSDERISVTRLAEPVLHPERNLVDVNYHVFVKDNQSGAVEELKETHTMRYLFSPEVELLLEAAGLRLLKSEEFLTSANLTFRSWSAVFVAALAR
jgi:SAM-dependent methyltransferase